MDRLRPLMNDRLIGYHGGLTDQERLIPVLVHEPAIGT